MTRVYLVVGAVVTWAVILAVPVALRIGWLEFAHRRGMWTTKDVGQEGRFTIQRTRALLPAARLRRGSTVSDGRWGLTYRHAEWRARRVAKRRTAATTAG